MKFQVLISANRHDTIQLYFTVYDHAWAAAEALLWAVVPVHVSIQEFQEGKGFVKERLRLGNSYWHDANGDFLLGEGY
jgi:hypothetical protein